MAALITKFRGNKVRTWSRNGASNEDFRTPTLEALSTCGRIFYGPLPIA